MSNIKKLSMFLILLILVALGFVLFLKYDEVEDIEESKDYNQVELNDKNITKAEASYVSSKNEQANVTYYSDDTAVLNSLGSGYKNISFKVATSASGARYENRELNLVLWEKAPEINIYKNDSLIFSGKKVETENTNNNQTPVSMPKEYNPDLNYNLVSYEWIWQKTEKGIRPVTDPNLIVYPKKPGAFVATFSKDGKVHMRTDCNTLNSSYSLDKNKMTFGSFMSTMMYCEGSQERDFSKTISSGKVFYVGLDNNNSILVLTSDQTILFTRGNKI